MKMKPVVLLALCLVLVSRMSAVAAVAAPENNNLITVVASKVDSAYVRSKLPNGDFATEYYSFADGGHWTGTVRDGSIDNVPFMDVARTVAGPLQNQGYLPAKDAKTTKLLIVVYWGRTRTAEHANEASETQTLQGAAANLAAAKSNNAHQFYSDSTGLAAAGTIPCIRYSASPSPDMPGTNDAMTGALASVAAADRSRDEINAQNAALLGYESWWDATAGFKGTPLEHRRQDMIEELEHDRYFVVLMAYDFQAMWKQKQHRLLWETRLSVQQRGVEFDKQLYAMVKNASPFFGQETHGLVRKDMPLGRVDIGDIRTLGTVAEK